MGKQPSYAALTNQYWGFSNDPSMTDQVLIEQMYIQTLVELSVNRFKWEGLPDGIDRRFVEMELHRNGLLVFFKDTDEIALRNGDKAGTDRYFALSATGAGEPNMYNNPTEFIAYGNHMMQRTLNARECVPIFANSTRIPGGNRAIYIYAKKLAKIDRTIDIVVESLRYSRLIAANANQRQSVVNVLRQIDEGKPAIFTTPGFDPSVIQALDIGVHPDVLPKLMDSRNSLWNQAMGFLGINNANQDKRERLVASEVQANDEQVLAVRASALNARQYAAEQINEMFGLEISVMFDQTAALTVQPDGQGQYTELDLNSIEKEADNVHVQSNASGSN